MSSTPNLRPLHLVSRTEVSQRFETVARLRLRVLVRACFATQEQCGDYLKVDARQLRRWLGGSARVPGWVLMALEQRARERGVRVEQPRAA